MSAVRCCLCCLGALLLSGCFADRAGLRRSDAGSPARDAGIDAGDATDAGRVDSGRVDSGGLDAGPTDAGVDAGPPDAGCGDAGAPPALTVWAPPSGGLTLDGDVSEWTDFGWVSIAAPGDFRQDGARPVADDAADLSARLAARWTGDALWFAVEVTDDVHQDGPTGGLLWRGDSLQLAFDVARNGGTSYDDTDDFEYGYARVGGGTARHRWIAPLGAAAPADDARTARTGSSTRYEVRLAPSDLGLSSFTAGTEVGFAFLVNENDSGGADREGFVEWASGIGHGKEPDAFGTLVLVASGCP